MKGSVILLTTCLMFYTTTYCEERTFAFDTFTSATPVFKVLYSKIERRLVLGARNAIYQLSENLKFSRQAVIGPVEDNAECPPNSLPCQKDRFPTDNDVKILLFASQGLVLMCGTVNQGKCHIYNPQLGSISLGLDNETTSYVAGRDSVVAFFTNDSEGHQTLYVAKSYGTYDRDNSLFGYAISSRVIAPSSDPKKLSFFYSHESDEAVTALNLHSHFRSSSHTKYVYGFGYGNFSFFLFTQRLGDGVYETRLARVCHGDQRLFSYSEVALRCMKESNKAYHLATTAYLGDASTTLKNKRKMKHDDMVLYVIFGRNRHGQEPLDENGSVLCMFPMNQIQGAFAKATKDCFNGEPRRRRIKTLLGSDTKCVKKTLADDEALQEAMCNPGINHYIEGSETVPGGVLVIVDEVVTSLAVCLQHSYTVAFLGTKSGMFSKYILEMNGDQGLMYQVRLVPETEERSDAAEILSSNAFDEHEQNLYLLTGNKLIRFPVGSCSPYKNCKECVVRKDPQGCGWCGDQCTTKQECSFHINATFKTDQCPPFVYEVYPLTGHAAGGTNLIIKGENLGSQSSGAKGKITVLVAGVDCEIIDWKYESVQCRTKAVQMAASGSVVVNVQDTSYDTRMDINGTAVYKTNFTYRFPRFYGVMPGFGAMSGGTEVTLVGEYLDIGSSQTVNMANVSCLITRKYINHIVCITGKFYPEHSNEEGREKIKGPVSLWIDGNRVQADPAITSSSLWTSFEYRPDPEIIDVSPKATSLSGGTDLVVQGRHLDSVAKPGLVVTVTHLVSGKQEDFIQPCTHGIPPETRLICRTPSLVDVLGEGVIPTGRAGIQTHISFQMDGVQSLRRFAYERLKESLLVYFRDPDFHRFSENRTTVRTDTRELLIKGSNLNSSLREQDIMVIVNGSIQCKVTRLSAEEVRCVLPDYTVGEFLNEEFPVLVRTAKLEFSLGSMKFVPPPTRELSTLEVFGVAMAAIILLVILFMVFYKLGILRRSEKKKETSGFAVSYRVNYAMDGMASRNDYQEYPGGVSSFRQDDQGACATASSRVLRVSEETMHLLSVENILISRESLSLQKEIGQGHFGRVYKGQLQMSDEKQSKNVAVKTLHNCRYQDTESAESFLQEGLMMKDFVHPHVLTLVGVCFEDTGFPMVILPFMKYGDLKSYIQDEKNEPTIKVLIEFGIQVAEGMKYLSDLKFVHRDLAARNCMLGEDLTVKVADFGLSRDVYERDYYSSDNSKSKLPVKWMAPESLEKGTYSTKSDVWSFGVVLWELMTRGVTPYPDVGNWEILTYIKTGRRMLQPSYCPEDIYRVMLRCWHEDPRRRPAFSEIAEEIRNVENRMKNRNHKVGLDGTYVNLPLPGMFPGASADERTGPIC